MRRFILVPVMALTLACSLLPMSIPVAHAGTIAKREPGGDGYNPCVCACITIGGKKLCVCVCSAD